MFTMHLSCFRKLIDTDWFCSAYCSVRKGLKSIREPFVAVGLLNKTSWDWSKKPQPLGVLRLGWCGICFGCLLRTGDQSILFFYRVLLVLTLSVPTRLAQFHLMVLLMHLEECGPNLSSDIRTYRMQMER